MWHWLPLLLEQVKGGNYSENSVNEIRQIVFSMHHEKRITQEVYNSLLQLISKYEYNIYEVGQNSLNLTNKTDLRGGVKLVASSELSICYTWKDIKNSQSNNKFKTSGVTWDEEFEVLNGSIFISAIQGVQNSKKFRK